MNNLISTDKGGVLRVKVYPDHRVESYDEYDIDIKFLEFVKNCLDSLEKNSQNNDVDDKYVNIEKMYIPIDQALEYVLENQFDEVSERVTEARANQVS